MRILGLDQATKITGYAIYDDDKLIKSGVIDYSNEKDMSKRIMLIKQDVDEIIQHYQIGAVAMEDVVYQRNPKIHKNLSKLLGAIEISLLESKTAYDILKTSEWRSACNIKGRKRAEQKKNAIKWAKKKFNINATEDEAEAIAIGWALVKKMGV